MNLVKAIDFQTQGKFYLPSKGKGNWSEWLASQGYIACNSTPVIHPSLKLYISQRRSLYALYHPPFQELDIEFLFVNIPDEKQALELASLAQKMLKMMSQLILLSEQQA